MWTLIVVLWLSPGYQVTGETGLTLDECKDKAFFEAKGEARCIKG